MKRRRTLGLLLPLTLVACHASNNDTAPSPSSSASVASPAASAFAHGRDPRRGPRGNGIEGLLFGAAEQLPTLTDDQRQKMDTAQDALEDRDTAPRDAMKTFSADLAAQIRAGKIDAPKLAPDEAAMDAALNGMVEKQAKAVSDLHDTLDASQRTALATNLHTNIASMPDPPSPANDKDGGAAADRVSHQVDRMASDLGLDDTQKKQVTALLMKDEKAKAARPVPDKKKDLDALLTAFQGDTFDAKASLTQAMWAGRSPHEGMDDQIKLTAAILPILKPDQREKLAAAAERQPAMGRPGPGMLGGMHGRGMGRPPGFGGPGMPPQMMGGPGHGQGPGPGQQQGSP